jgi:hypothetical protein
MSVGNNNRITKEDLDYDFVIANIENTNKVHIKTISMAIVREAKILDNYGNAEKLFEIMQIKLKERQENGLIGHHDVGAFQKAITTMVRYSDGLKNAYKYFLIALEDYKPPLRDQTLEVMLITNLINYLCRLGGKKNRNRALTLAEGAVKMGAYHCNYPPPPSQNQIEDFSDPFSHFEEAMVRILDKFDLEVNADKTEIVPKRNST